MNGPILEYGNVFRLQGVVVLGRPRDPNVDSSLNCLAASFTPSSFPVRLTRLWCGLPPAPPLRP